MNKLNKQIVIWASIIIGIYLIHRLASVFIPFVISLGLAYLANPLVMKIESRSFFGRRLSRTWAVSLVFTIIIISITIILLIGIPLLVNQIIVFVNKIPQYYEWIQMNIVPKLSSIFDIEILNSGEKAGSSALTGSIDLLKNISKKLATSIGSSTLTIVGFVASLVLIPMLTFYFMRDWNGIMLSVEKLIPRSMAPKVTAFLSECDEMLSSFLRGQFTVMLILASIYSIGLSIVGLEYGVLIGVTAGLISFIPYLGASSGIAMGLIVAWFQFGDLKHLIFVGIVFGIGQLMESFALTPILIGDKLGMHPIAVVFALMVGGSLFGFFGILLALPVCAILMVALRHLYTQYTQSKFYGGID